MSEEKQSVANLRKRFEVNFPLKSTSDDIVDKPVKSVRQQVSVIEKESSQQKTNTSEEQHDNQSLPSKQPLISPKRPPLPPKPQPKPKPTKQQLQSESASQRFNAETSASGDKVQTHVEVIKVDNKEQILDEINVISGEADKSGSSFKATKKNENHKESIHDKATDAGAGLLPLLTSPLNSESEEQRESLHDIGNNNSDNTEIVIEVDNEKQILDIVNVNPGEADKESRSGTSSQAATTNNESHKESIHVKATDKSDAGAEVRSLFTSLLYSRSVDNKESLHDIDTNNSEHTKMNESSIEATIQNVSENQKESILDKINDKSDAPKTNWIEKDTKIKVQSQNHDQFPQQDESKIQSRTIMFTNEGGLKDDTYVKETKHEEIVNLDTAAEMIADAFGMTANDSSTDAHSDIETESSSTSSSRNGNSDASISDSGLSDDHAQSDEDSEGSGTVVERDRTEVVERDRIEVVERDRTEVVERDRTEYMVEAYMQFIKHQISVTDIIKHIDFIGPRERDIILSKHKWCASDAFELLIDEIKKSTAKGKWQTFLQALESKGLKYIKLLLEEKTETHHDGNREVLKHITPELVKRLYLPTFLDKIYENELLTEDVKELVEAQRREYGEYAAIEVALDNVGKQNENWNIILIKIFEELGLGDIADLFEFIKPKRQSLQVPGATSLPTKGRNTKKREREWRLENLSTTKTQHSVSVENDDSMQFAEIQFPPIDQSLPTRQDFVKLTSEIRKLRKTAERQILRGQAVNY